MSRPSYSSCSCQDFNRSELLRRGVAPGRRAGCRRSSRGCRRRPAPASRGAASCSPRRASRCRSTAPGGLLDPAAFEAGIAAGRRSAADAPVLVSVYLQGGIDSMSVLYPAGDPLYGQYRTDARAARGRGAGVHRGPAPVLAPAGGAARPAARRGQGQRDADGRLHRPQPVALHEPPLLGGGRHPGRPAAPAGWGATSTSSAPPTTRCRASASTTRCSPALATAQRAGRDDRPALRLLGLGAAASGGRRRTIDVRRLRRARPRRRALARPRHGPVRRRRR